MFDSKQQRTFTINGQQYREVRTADDVTQEIRYLQREAAKLIKQANEAAGLIQYLVEYDAPASMQPALEEFSHLFSDLETELAQANKRLAPLVDQLEEDYHRDRDGISQQQLQTQQRYQQERQPGQQSQQPQQQPKQPGRAKRWFKKMLNFPEQPQE